MIANGDRALHISMRHGNRLQGLPSLCSVGHEGHQLAGPAHDDADLGVRPLLPQAPDLFAIKGCVRDV